MLEAILHAHAAKGAKGDTRSASLLIGLLPRVRLLDEQDGQTDHADRDEMNGAPLVISAKSRPADVLIQDIDIDRLTVDEQIELSLGHRPGRGDNGVVVAGIR
jgi:hypothetical protein